MTERKRFMLEAEGGLFSHAEPCRRYGISRPTDYTWLERYRSPINYERSRPAAA